MGHQQIGSSFIVEAGIQQGVVEFMQQGGAVRERMNWLDWGPFSVRQKLGVQP
jgi:hypothetical protein